MKFLNIACGNSLINSEFWTNIDFTSNDKSVKRMNVLSDLPYDNDSFDVIYTSHFLEHIPREDLSSFLKECLRLLKPGGMIRIVMPDLEFLIKEYFFQIENNDIEKLEFLSLLIFDQCVRNKRGGLLKKYLYDLSLSNNDSLKKYVFELVGDDSGFMSERLSESNFYKRNFLRIVHNPFLILDALTIIRNYAVSFLFSRSFRKQNISFASLGEKHMLLYDNFLISEILKKENYKNISKEEFNTTSWKDNIFKDLDEKNCAPRKGTHQIFIEAYK
tara:strand:- start:847 stop:1668 length:822 start_codon:yes stop_codon:yes gene_type:complete